MSQPFTPCAPQSREIAVPFPDGFTLACGAPLTGVVRARLIGPQTGALIVVAGGISAGRRAADDADGPGWWGWTIGAGAPIDTARHRVLAFDWLPGADVDRVVTITTGDQARLLALVLDHIGATIVDAFVGASYGGCVGLAFAEAFRERIGRLVVISAAHRAHPAATAWRGVQRRILQLGLDTGRQAETVALARELAMTTYRTPDEFEARFGAGAPPAQAGGAYAVCDYLTARGRAYIDAAPPRRWISLSDSLDRHSVDPAALACPLTLVGFDSDRLVPLSDVRALAERAPNPTRLIEAASPYGHDAFLKERGLIAEVLAAALSDLDFTCSQEIAA